MAGLSLFSAFGAGLETGEPVVRGERVQVPIRVALGADEPVSALNFTFTYDPTVFSLEAVTPGPVARAADKRVTAREVAAGRVNLVVSGINNVVLSSPGTLAAVALVQSADPREGITQFSVAGVTMTTPEAQVVPSQGSVEEVSLSPLSERRGNGAPGAGGDLSGVKPSQGAEPGDGLVQPDAASPAGESTGAQPGPSAADLALLEEAMRQVGELRAEVEAGEPPTARSAGESATDVGQSSEGGEAAPAAGPDLPQLGLEDARVEWLGWSGRPEETPTGRPLRPRSEGVFVGVVLVASGGAALAVLFVIRKRVFG